MKAEVISKATGTVTNVSADTIDLTAPSIVRLDLTRADVAGFERQGQDLIVKLASGEQIRIADFYGAAGATPNDLVLRDGDGSLWQARIAPGTPHFAAIKDIDDLATTSASGGSSLTIPAVLGGLVAAGGAAALVGGGGGSARSVGTAVPDPDGGTTPTPDRDPPAAPTAIVRSDGSAVAGRGESGATVSVRNDAGAVIGTGTVGADGSYAVNLAQGQTNGERLTVTQADAAGNVSPAVPAIAPDLTAPTAPTATLGNAGTTVSGTGEAGATVTVRDAGGNVIGSGTVAAGGSYTLTLPQGQTNGERLTVTQADATGNVSTGVSLTAPDTTAPTPPTATLGTAGTTVIGTGEAGATVVVRDAGGTVIGSGTVAAGGSYTVTLPQGQTNGEPLTVTQADAAGNVSTGTSLTAPDATAPTAPTATLGTAGTTVIGTGEAGATVVVRDAGGTVIGSGTVGAGGSYTVVLPQGQANGEQLTVTQADAAGNVSTGVSLTAPDTTAPAQPTATINADGTIVTGAGEAGAQISVADAAGAVIGTATVGADGTYNAALTPAQANGQVLSVGQTDAAGNAAPPLSLTAPDITAPAAPIATLDATGSVVLGTGEAGATVTVRDGAGGILGTAIVGAQGGYTVTLASAQIDRQPLTVVQTDAAGNASSAAPLTAPDLTAPTVPTATVAADGTALDGRGEPGATVTVRDPLGAAIGTAVVAADGSYAVALSPAQVDGQVLAVTQADTAGNVSPATATTAPDLVVDSDPAAPTAGVAPDGAAVTGTALAGATITVTDASGTVIGTGVADAGGAYSVTLSPPRIDGETVRVTQTEADGDVSPAATAVAPDLTAPAVPTAALDSTGAVVTGRGEPGATVTVRAPDGSVLGTAVATAAGDYVVALSPAQNNGGTVTVSQADAAGNVSPSVTLPAPDTTAPDAPTAAVGPDGGVVTGTGEPGATVIVRDARGTVLGSTPVAADGSYAVTLAPAQANGGTVSVTVTDPAGNVSPATGAPAPDITAPAAPVATIVDGGAAITGTGEPGATVSVAGPGGGVIGTGIVDTDGRYTVALAPAQANGEALTVVQTDAAGNASPDVSLIAPDLTAPAAPTAIVTGDGTTVTGIGEPGATVTITSPAGTPIGTALVAADGSYAATLSTPQINGERLGVTQADAAGNVSGSTSAVAPDTTAPATPTAAIGADGTVVTGTGEPGARIAITDAGGVVVGTAVVAADGNYGAPLTPAQANGEALSVVQIDPAGNSSPALPLTAPDITAPPAPVAALDPTGTIVTGTGEPGARVTVADAGGTAIGSAIVAASGSYTVVLSPAQVDRQPLAVVQTDPAGNASPATGLTAPDLTAPAAPTGTVAGDGASLTGTGEAGATVTVRDPLGQTVGTAVVAPDGSYVVALAPAQIDGEQLSVVQADRAGNVSPPVAAVAPDLVVDSDPPAPTAAVDATGTAVVGTAIGGAAITVYDATGTVIGTGIAGADGSYSVALSPSRIDGETVRVTQTEADGDVSPPATAIAPDLTAPGAPVATLDPTGTVVTGTGEPGAIVTVAAADGTPLGTATVTAGGAYAVTLSAAQLNGEALAVTQADAAGNVSAPTGLVAADVTAPAVPIATVGGDGTTLFGTGEPGTTAIVRDAAGAVIGSAPVGADGGFTVALTPAQANGETVSVTLADAAGNVSAPTLTAAPDITAPDAPTATLAGAGNVVTGLGEPGATVSISSGGIVIGTAVVAANGSYSVPLTPALANGETLAVSQADPTGNVSPSTVLTAPDTTAPGAPTATVANGGAAVVGTGEPGATVSISSGGTVIGTAVVGNDGTYTATLTPAQTNGETLVATQADPTGNVSAPVNAVAPDTTAPAAPTTLAVGDEGTTLSGRGEAGAQVQVRGTDGSVIGTGTVATDGSFTVALAPAQVMGGTLTVTQVDGAGNVSPPAGATAPFDIAAFDNSASAGIDLLPATSQVTLGSAGYVALVSLGLVNLQAQVLAVPSVQFTVQPGHSLDAVFTYDAVLNLGVASGYSVVVQRLEGGQWVSVGGGSDPSLVQLGLFGGDLQGSETLEPGTYRAFLTFDGAAGAGVLGSLAVTGLDSDFTTVAGVVPAPTQGNVITDPGVGGQVDVVSADTHVTSVTVNGAVIAVTTDGTVVDGAWGTLVIDLDGHYTYTPDADPAAIGRTDVFTYTLLDPSDGERENANLSITIGSADVTGPPVAANDQAIAGATYQNVVETIAPAVEFSFATPGTLVVPQTGSGSDSFTVAANSTADVTITAVSGGLSLLPTYVLTVTDAGGAVVATLTQPSLAGLPIGTGTVFTLQDLPSGTYNYSVSSTNVAGTGYGTTVSLGETVTHLDRFVLTGTTAATGNILDNDAAHSPFAAIRVDTGGGFATVGDTPVTLVGEHGTLTLNETGGYTYQPSATIGYSAVDLVDHFTYQLVQPGGATATATLAVTIDGPGAAPAVSAVTLAAIDHDVVPLDALVTHGAEVAASPPAPAIGIATYDLFEGQGELETVLGHYLATQPVEDTTVAASGHSAATMAPVESPIVDPLDYLVTVDNQDHHAINGNHVV